MIKPYFGVNLTNFIFKIQGIATRNKKLHYILVCIKRINNNNFIDIVLGKTMNLKMIRYGERNKNNNIYLIEIDQETPAFGAYFRSTLFALFEADRLGFIPVINWGSKCCYYECDNFKNTNNVFEYYFTQPTHIGVEETLQSSRVFLFETYHLFKFIFDDLDLVDKKSNKNSIYNISETSSVELGRIVQKYIKLNYASQKFIDDSINDTFPKNWQEKKILSIHARGTDFALKWGGHPKIVEIEEYFSVIDALINEKNFEYIFLATDDSLRLKEFKKHYGKKLIYFQDVHRSDGKVNVSFEKIDRPNNSYKNGLEVLRDIYAMAFCNGLIAGYSNISLSAFLINKSLNRKFEYIQFIDKGTN